MHVRKGFKYISDGGGGGRCLSIITKSLKNGKMCLELDEKCSQEKQDLKYIMNPLKPDWKDLTVVRKSITFVSKGQ